MFFEAVYYVIIIASKILYKDRAPNMGFGPNKAAVRSMDVLLVNL